MIATGAALGYKPWEVMHLTPAELAAAVRGHKMLHGEAEPEPPDLDKIKQALAAFSKKDG